MAMNLRSRPRLVALLIALASEAIFLVRLSVPDKLVFDEVHYVPAARMMRALAAPANIEHPLLAKELIAIGLALFGDKPFGWRFMSTLAGAATIAGMFALAWLLTRHMRAALLSAALGLLSFTVYIQARIAMLDTFLAAFLLWAIVMLGWSVHGRGYARWCVGAVLLGLATACKWSAAFYVVFAAVTFLVMRRGHPGRWRGMRPLPALALLGVLSVATYFATFAPAFFYDSDRMTLARLIPWQYDMYLRQTQVLPPHTYQSNWWTWPFLIRPIWYLYEPVAGVQRGILFMGNPVIMWGGLVAVAFLFWNWVKTGEARLLAPAMLWSASVLMWAAIPKSLGFYYYYYPSSIFLTVALAVALDRARERRPLIDEAVLFATFAVALYFLPVLTAEPLTDAGAFRRWTWFASWV